MAEDLSIDKTLTREEQYRQLFPQIEGLIAGETNRIANLANIASAIKYAFDFLWVGFYLVEGDELVLGPFQGPPACTRIKKGKGVCGTSWEKQMTLIVPDVEAFPGHIACSSNSRSEIVVPVLHNGQVRMVLDVDSDHLNNFNETDKIYLEKICSLIQI
ncbi:MAG TPA: GAF domain-containing protein [Flavobacteriales bacterium]|nr:GAF domain-containing protein [Flavobacteriales bacterium]